MITADGVACAASGYRQGRHLLRCPSGGGYFIGHGFANLHLVYIASSISEKANDEKWSPSAMPTACDLSQFYISCRITGVPPLQSDFSGLSSALKDDAIEPLAFERHGFIAKETAALIRKLAHLKAAHFELGPSEETRRWYVALSCCVQRANAKILRGEAVPRRGASIPSRLLSGNRDLAVCGS